MWLLKRLNAAMLWFLKTFWHLTKSYGFSNVPHILGIGKLVVCNNRGKNGVVLPDVVRSLTQASHLSLLWF